MSICNEIIIKVQELDRKRVAGHLAVQRSYTFTLSSFELIGPFLLSHCRLTSQCIGPTILGVQGKLVIVRIHTPSQGEAFPVFSAEAGASH